MAPDDMTEATPEALERRHRDIANLGVLKGVAGGGALIETRLQRPL